MREIFIAPIGNKTKLHLCNSKKINSIRQDIWHDPIYLKRNEFRSVRSFSHSTKFDDFPYFYVFVDIHIGNAKNPK